MKKLNTKDLVSFGNYLLSEERKQSIESAYNEHLNSDYDNPMPVSNVLSRVNHADIENWKSTKTN